MAKETEEMPSKNNDNADQTVSTQNTDILQTNSVKKLSVVLESNVIENINKEANTNKLDTSGNSEIKIKNNNLDSEKKDSAGQEEKSGIKEIPRGMTEVHSANQNEHKKADDAEEEDVPGDFFDDFLKEDFMAGLDIVDDDAWEKEVEAECPEIESAANIVETKKRKEKKKPKSSNKIDHVERFHASPPGEKRNKQKKKKDDKEKHMKKKEKAIDADEFDIRRDPEKTKRDIEQYKAKCEKDKEKKIISEKLSLVETGLVPPGMEMEIDIEEVKRQKSKIEQNQPPRDLRERLRRLRSKSKSPNRRKRSPRRKSESRRSISPIKITSPSTKTPLRKASPLRKSSPLRKTSPKKRRTRSPKRVKSPLRRSPLRISPLAKRNSVTRVLNSQKLSPLRSRKSPLLFRDRSPMRRSRVRSYERQSPARRSRSRSPYYRSRRARYSPFQRHRDRSGSRESDREKWLRRRRTRSRSPKRKRDEKKSFLQEIAEKLNETRPVNMMQHLQPQMHYVLPQLAPVPVPVPTPAPVPPPNNPPFFQSTQQPPQQFDPYDQNFFIGTQQPVAPPNFIGQLQNKPPPSVGFSQQQIPLNPLSIQPINSPQLQNSVSPVGSNTSSRNVDRPISQPQGQINAGITGNKQDLAKLFQDKKITLSEFLAITAKPEVLSSSPTNLQEKIKVIQRCHEAIKILGSAEKKYVGKLVVHRTDNYKVAIETNASPLLRKPPVTFPFTQLTRDDQKTSFTNFINQLLQKMGLMKEVVVDVDKVVPTNVGVQPPPQELCPPPPPTITQNRNVVHNELRSNRSSKLTNNQLSKFIQTDVFKCENCEKRNRILYKSTAVQCGSDSSTFSVSTQVTEDDFQLKIQKTQSLASLTPAQLLANSRSGSNRLIDKDIFDIATSQSNYPSRLNYMHPSDAGYSLSQYRSPNSPPLHFNPMSREEAMPPMYNSRSPFIGGGGRGRDNPPNLPRSLDPNNRLGYNYY